ncbi:LLM class F420-dependent oxidoreductase [Mycolicibacterium baixiangningiae]|uniref:LLM class F420-dependent oxidoreductase n=1 Tax=Mycolicibacterium baixiangningiae TaxID=2761578 RepID=UPI001865C408|nr:LLM class F420-dependent oxidoreductase [Mycolicibacterium baixiangningiae]
MRLGLSTPVVVQVPGVASEWERDAGVEELAGIVTLADELGFDFLTCSEHIAVPAADAAGRGSTYWDPLSTLGFFAARTGRIRLATSVVVLGYHHPLEIAKRFGTLDRLSGGRLVLGVGVGSLAEEFALLGADWENRGAKADEAMRALRASMSTTHPQFDGAHFRYDGLVVDPCAVQPRVPIWVGGRTMRSLRRAVELGDGWMPFGLGADEITAMLGSVGIPSGFDVVLSTGRALDPINEPDGTAARLRRLAAAGATAVTCAVAARSAAHYREQLSALAATIDDVETTSA